MKRFVLVLLVSSLLAGCSKPEAPPPTLRERSQTSATVTQSTPVAPPSATAAPGDAVPAAGAVLWLAADDTAGSAISGKVASWASGRGLAGAAKAGSAEAQPAVVANAINGHAVVRFNGEKNMLVTDIDISPARMPEATIVAVFNSRTAAISPLRKLYGDDDGGYDRAAGLDTRGDTKNYTVFTGHGVKGYFELEVEKPYITVDQYSAKQFSGWVNGAAVLSKVEAEWGPALPNLYIGGTGTSFQELWNGDLAEFIVYGRTLTDDERIRVEDYLGHKYGVALSRTPAPTATP